MSLALKSIVSATTTYEEHTGLVLKTTTEYWENKEEDAGYATEPPSKTEETSQSITSTQAKTKDGSGVFCAGVVIGIWLAVIVAILGQYPF